MNENLVLIDGEIMPIDGSKAAKHNFYYRKR